MFISGNYNFNRLIKGDLVYFIRYIIQGLKSILFLFENQFVREEGKIIVVLFYFNMG